MVKKAFMIGLGGLVLGGILLGRQGFSYLRTSVSCVRDAVHEHVPIDFELHRARKMIEDLKPEIARNMHRIAREEVEVAQLQKQLETLESQQVKTQQAVLRMHADLQTDSANYVYAKRTFSKAEVEKDLAHRFAHCKTLDETVGNLRRVLDYRQTGLTAGRQKLDELLRARDQLKLDVEGLEARSKMLEVQQTASQMAIDDSQLSQTRDLVTEIRSRLQVAEKLMTIDGEYQVAAIPLENEEHQDLMEQIAAYFHTDAASPEAEQLAEVTPDTKILP